MTLLDSLLHGFTGARALLPVMALVGLLETAIPLHARSRWSRVHLAPNLALTGLTLGVNLLLDVVLVATLAELGRRQLGLLDVLSLPAPAAAVIAIVVLDLATWGAHRAMHHSPLLWRFHRVHHADPVVDVTTSFRQHPGESAVRFAVLAAVACVLGASPAAFAVYRTASALQALLEHANLRLPARLDSALSLLVATPNLHKVHHSRVPAETDTNYGNLLSLFDRASGTFTPAVRGVTVRTGLDGCDDPKTQSTAGLLALPFRRDPPRGSDQRSSSQ